MDEITNLMLKQIKEIDERDEGQILAELAGETIEEYIYEIPGTKSRKRTVKLSWVGTREMGRAKGNITLSDPIIEDSDGYIRVVIRANDLKRNFSIFGGCHQLKQQRVKIYDQEGKELGYQTQDDPHYFSKALSKAQRNVIQAIMPASFMAKMIDRFLIMAGREPLKQLPQPKVSKPRVAKGLSEVKPEEVPDFHHLELIAYNRWHVQPTEVYQQLGYQSKADCKETPWECFIKLQQIYEYGVKHGISYEKNPDDPAHFFG